jgi:cysteine synthase A
VPPHWNAAADRHLGIGDDEAQRWRRRLAVTEGLYVGFSAAANVAAAAHLLASQGFGRDTVVATVLCDTGLKY